jgi:hypothetical protein
VTAMLLEEKNAVISGVGAAVGGTVAGAFAAVGGVVSAAQTPLVTGRRCALIIPDWPRAIDRYIDYFGGRGGGPATPWSGATPDRHGRAGSSGSLRTPEPTLGGTVGPAPQTPAGLSHISRGR